MRRSENNWITFIEKYEKNNVKYSEAAMKKNFQLKIKKETIKLSNKYLKNILSIRSVEI